MLLLSFICSKIRFRIPHGDVMRSKWLKSLSDNGVSCNSSQNTMSKYKYVCSEHFENEMYRSHTNIKRLKKDAVPVLFGNDMAKVRLFQFLSFQYFTNLFNHFQKYLPSVSQHPEPQATDTPQSFILVRKRDYDHLCAEKDLLQTKVVKLEKEVRENNEAR